MKITILLSHLGGGGLERGAVKQAAWLTDQGHDVTVLLFGCKLSVPGPEDIRRVELTTKRPPVRLVLDLARSGVPIIDAIKVIKRSNQFRSSGYYYHELKKYLRSMQPEIIISHKWELTILSAVAARATRTSPRLIAWEHGEMVWKNLGSAMKRLRKSTFCCAEAVVAISKGLARMIESTLDFPSGAVASVYQPILPDEFASSTSGLCDQQSVFDRGRKNVLAIGRIHPIKGYDVLLRAFAIVAENTDARLIVMGPDGVVNGASTLGQLKSLSSELGLDDLVVFPGPTRTPIECMRKADVFVLSSHSEGLGSTTVEALAAGTTVVATDCSAGVREVFGENDYAFLVPVDEPAALAEGICKALNTPFEKEMLTKRAEAFAEKHHFKALKRMLEEGVPPPRWRV